MIDREQASDAAKAIALKIEFERHLFGLLIVAERTRCRGVLATTQLALEALASGAVKACFDLLLGSLAIRTGKHVKLYNIVRLDLDSPTAAPGLTK